MTYTTIDSLVKGWLLKRQYPMHWYLQALLYAIEGVGQLRSRTLKVIKTEIVKVGADGRIDLPCDVEFVIRLGVAVGDKIKPLVKGKGSFNRMQNVDATGNAGPYGDSGANNYIVSWYGSLLNDLGEFNGGVYGFGAGHESDVYEEFPEHNQIQVSQGFAGKELFLDFVPAMNSCDSLTWVPTKAVVCISQYITWQLKENGRHYGKGEAKDEERMFYRYEELLRASSLNADDFMRARGRTYHRSTKN